MVGDDYELKGMITVKDFQKATEFPRACKDERGALRVGAEAVERNGQWTVSKAIMSRSARVLMDGAVRVPADVFD